MKICKLYILFFLFFATFSACEDEIHVPKPKAYFRIDLPKPSYEATKIDCPYTIEINQAAFLNPVKTSGGEQCWFNIEYPTLHATVHLSYKPVNKNLNVYTEDARALVYKHTIKASDIRENTFFNDEHKTYSTVYELYGNTASALQFNITDSSKHFLRGSLYFNLAPNADSLEPVIKYVKADIKHLIETLQWK